jgi:S-adenosyl-L-methionine hydrolase (adenosine-forming)
VFITFLSDFGLADDFVGTCHAVMKRIAPQAQIIDLTHGIPPQDVLQGALVLANTLPYAPIGVHLAIVDPGVGSGRRALALEAGEGRRFVGPDNGLLLPAAERLGGVAAAHELTNPEYALTPVSATFHGRDIFSPAAAQLALGLPLAELGPPVDPEALVRLELPTPEVEDTAIRAECLYVDRFGNMQLNLTNEQLEGAGIVPGRSVRLLVDGARHDAVAARTFADAEPGRLILYEDSYGNIALAVSRGDAAGRLGAQAGAVVEIEVPA